MSPIKYTGPNSPCRSSPVPDDSVEEGKSIRLTKNQEERQVGCEQSGKRVDEEGELRDGSTVQGIGGLGQRSGEEHGYDRQQEYPWYRSPEFSQRGHKRHAGSPLDEDCEHHHLDGRSDAQT